MVTHRILSLLIVFCLCSCLISGLPELHAQGEVGTHLFELPTFGLFLIAVVSVAIFFNHKLFSSRQALKQ